MLDLTARPEVEAGHDASVRTIPALHRPDLARRAVAWTLAGLAVAWAAWTILGLAGEIARQAAHNLDLLPLWLGGKALLHHRDPTDPEVLRELFLHSRIRMRPTGFHTYYPQTAALVFAPLGLVDFATLGRWLPPVFGAALLAGTALPAVATATGGPRRVAAVALASGIAASFPMVAIVIGMGQSNAVLVGLTGLGLWALARDHRVTGGVAIGLGIGVKVFPAVLLVPAILGRRWRMLGIAVAVPIGVLLTSLLFYAGPWAGSPLGLGAAWFAGTALSPADAGREPAVVRALWHARIWLPGALAVGFTAWTARVRKPAAIPALGALWVAWVGTVMAGSSMPHQAMVILPALGWVLGWPLSARRFGPALAAVALLAATMAWRHVLGEHWTRSLQWLPVCWAVVLGCAARAADALIPAGKPR